MGAKEIREQQRRAALMHLRDGHALGGRSATQLIELAIKELESEDSGFYPAGHHISEAIQRLANALHFVASAAGSKDCESQAKMPRKRTKR